MTYYKDQNQSSKKFSRISPNDETDPSPGALRAPPSPARGEGKAAAAGGKI
jgi:hypothetical protein